MRDGAAQRKNGTLIAFTFHVAQGQVAASTISKGEISEDSVPGHITKNRHRSSTWLRTSEGSNEMFAHRDSVLLSTLVFAYRKKAETGRQKKFRGSYLVVLCEF